MSIIVGILYNFFDHNLFFIFQHFVNGLVKLIMNNCIIEQKKFNRNLGKVRENKKSTHYVQSRKLTSLTQYNFLKIIEKKFPNNILY